MIRGRGRELMEVFQLIGVSHCIAICCPALYDTEDDEE